MKADRYLAKSDIIILHQYSYIYSILYCNTPSLVVTEDWYSASCTITHSEKLLILSELEVSRT